MVYVKGEPFGRGAGRSKRPPRPTPPQAWTALDAMADEVADHVEARAAELDARAPEVEVVRRGLQAHVAGKTITAVRVDHPRAVRRHEAGAADLTCLLLGTRITGTDRRGKYLWLNLVEGAATTTRPLVVHLGMSGQMLLGPVANTNHRRIAAMLDDGTALSFVDQQRTFGGWQLADLVSVDGSRLPTPVAHIARDPLDPRFDRAAVVKCPAPQAFRDKRQLLDQTVVSGIGNIYADEALWRARVNGARIAAKAHRRQLRRRFRRGGRRDARSPHAGGTRSIRCTSTSTGSLATSTVPNVYGREDRNCPRCGAGDPPGEVHEPLVVLLPGLPAAATGCAGD